MYPERGLGVHHRPGLVRRRWGIEAVPGAEGKVIDDGEDRFLLVEEVEAARRLVFRWASFGDPPSRVEIELAPFGAGTRIKITEMPINARA